MSIKKLYDEKAAIYADMKDLQQRLKSEDRAMTADEQERFEKANDSLERVEKQIQDMKRLEAISAIDDEPETETRNEEPKYLDVFLKLISQLLMTFSRSGEVDRTAHDNFWGKLMAVSTSRFG